MVKAKQAIVFALALIPTVSAASELHFTRHRSTVVVAEHLVAYDIRALKKASDKISKTKKLALLALGQKGPPNVTLRAQPPRQGKAKLEGPPEVWSTDGKVIGWLCRNRFGELEPVFFGETASQPGWPEPGICRP